MNICLLLSKILGSRKGPPVATYSISGDIVDGADAGIEGVLVTLSGDADDTDTTDANGHYEFTGLVDGSYTVTPSKDFHTFNPTSRAVEVSGDDAVADDMVGTEYLTLPFEYDFSDLTVGNGVDVVGNETGFDATFFTGTGVSAYASTASLADSNSYTPSGVTKVIEQDGSESVTYSVLYDLPFSVLPSSLTKMRFEALVKATSSTARSASFNFGLSNGQSGVGTYFIRTWGRIYDGDWQFAVLYQDPSSSSDSYLGTMFDITRWHRVRAEIDFTAKTIAFTIVLHETGATVSSHTLSSLSFLAENSYEYTKLFAAFGGNGDTTSSAQIAKVWIGTGTDAWPT